MVNSSSHMIDVTWDEMEAWYQDYEDSDYQSSLYSQECHGKAARKTVRWTKDEVLLLKRLAKLDGVIKNAALFARNHARNFPNRTVAAIKNKVYRLKLYTNPNK